MINITRQKYYFYLILVGLLILVSFYSGFELGRSVEKDEWLEIVDRQHTSFRILISEIQQRFFTQPLKYWMP